MSAKSLRQFAARENFDLAKRNLHMAEIRLETESVTGQQCERGLVDLLLANATNYLSRVVKTEDGKVADLELRIADAHRLRAALDCRLQRTSFRLVKGGGGVLS